MVVACWAPSEAGAGTYPPPPPWSAQIALERPSPRAPCARPGSPRTCRPPCAGLSGGRADRAHRWRRLGRRGPEGDVTGSGPGGRNRAAAASVAQQRTAAAQRAGAATTSRAPGTRRQSETDRRTRGQVAPPLPPRGAPACPSPATWSSRPRPPQVRGCGKGAKPPPLTGPVAPRWGPDACCPASPAGPGAGACLFSQPAPRESSLPAWWAAGKDHRLPPPGPGLGVKTGVPRRGAPVCSRDRSELAGTRSAAQIRWGRARRPRRAPKPWRSCSGAPDP